MINKINHTQLSNDFIDNHMKNISGNATKVFIIISRKTIGWHKDTDKISYSQLMEYTGIKSKETLNKAINELESYGLIIISRVQKINQYEINYTNESVQKMYHDSTETVPKNIEIGTENVHTKESIKETNTKEKDIYYLAIIDKFFKYYKHKYNEPYKSKEQDFKKAKILSKFMKSNYPDNYEQILDEKLRNMYNLSLEQKWYLLDLSKFCDEWSKLVDNSNKKRDEKLNPF